MTTTTKTPRNAKGQIQSKKVAAKKAPTKKAAPAKKAPAKKVAPAKVVGFDAEALAKRISDLRTEGQSWRVLSATLNTEGITTIRGKAFSANGSTAFLFAGKRGIK